MAELDGAKLARQGEGEPIWFNGSLITVKISSMDTNNAYVLVETLGRAGNVTPLHIDPTVETFRVLEGELLFHIDGHEERLAAGDAIVIPQGIPHALMVTSSTARTLVFNAPGGHDRFFRAAGTPGLAGELPPPGPPDFERMRAAAAQYGIKIVGPPPFASPLRP